MAGPMLTTFLPQNMAANRDHPPRWQTLPSSYDGMSGGSYSANNPFDTPSYLDRHSSGTIMMDDLGCSGTEATLFDCSGTSHFSHNCVHAEDAWVVCSGASVTAESIRSATKLDPEEQVQPKTDFVGEEILANEDEADKTEQPGTNKVWQWNGVRSVENLVELPDERDDSDKN